jgi:Phage capsid family
MIDREAKRNRIKEIGAEVEKRLKAGTVTMDFMNGVELETKQLEAELKGHKRALEFRAGSEIGAAPFTPKTKGGPKWNPPSPRHASEEQVNGLWLAAKNRLPSYSFEIGEKAVKSMSWGDDNIRTKQVVEGPPGTLLPPALLPQHTLNLPYEPDRIFEHFVGAMADSQSIQYLQHTGNASPALPTPELGTKIDLGMQWAPKTVSFQKISALASVSTEALDDFNVFYQFTSNDLHRAVTDAETNWIINQSVTGLNWQTNTLKRLIGADTPLDALEKAVDDIRVGSAFATADTMAMHPATFGYLKRQKSTLNTYILQQNVQTGQVDSIWGCKPVINSYIPLDLVIVWDSTQAIYGWTRQALTVMLNPWGSPMWQTNFVSFRAEERIAVGYPRPTAINLVTGFPSSGS